MDWILLVSLYRVKRKRESSILIPQISGKRWKRLLKFFSRLFLVDKTFIYENPYEGVWGVLGNSSYKPFYNDLSPLETISNLCFSNFSWKQSKQWTVVGYIYYIIYVTQYIHKQVWWNVFEIMGYAPLYLKSIKCF